MAVPAVVWSLVLMVVKWLSPVARDAFSEAMKSFYKVAMESPNQLDDIAAKVIVTMLNVDVSGVTFTPPAAGSAPAEVVAAITGGLIEVGTGRPFDPAVDSGP
jgi:hypothetical protein